jgi:hypothetical protein
MIKRFDDERGIAMVTALLVSLAVLFLSIAVVALSLHNTSISAFDRKRIQAIDAAEAGIDAWYSGLTTATGGAVCNGTQWDGTLPTTPSAAYDVSITLYSGWPPAPGLPPVGNEMTCPVNPTDPLSTAPLGALVVSKGTAVTSTSPVSVSRTMQSEARLTPIYGGFNKAIFSDSVLNLQNKLTVNGYQGNDGDVYTNGNYSLNNNTTIAGSVYAQGYADISQGVVKANVWGNNYVHLTNGIQVFGNATSSTSYISLDNNSTVFGNAKAGTTIGGGTINGTSTPNSPSGPPPQTPLPHLLYDATAQCAWTCPPPTGAGYIEVDYSSCAAAQAFITSGAVGNYVVRISPTCALSWGNNSVINIKGNLAIITDGSFTTLNQTNWNSVGGAWTLFIIRPWPTSGTLNCSSGNYDINVSNNTNFNNGLKVFVYTPCTVNFGNNNAEGFNGQIIGGNVNITNQMVVNYVPILVPGFNLLGYNIQPSYLREIANSTPSP